ncbi:aminotransferase class I and II [Desulfovibrio sp. X2]|uniref:pyridoxal phosphate-dependent aminotransferase n=1 Tax=Desulfovibrio sp. X2 TaxID=941449 RepID=UPI000358AF0D|nr:pyridoxal phosphate-dependent aminotransferase [Desulfovibrio sp. X2]EPR44219.1 aminotransferase class I and II [Desulfovibrio sp. X2]
MSVLSSQVTDYLGRSSWIRKMFEEGAKLKQQHGVDAVCDFSLGNPDLPPPLAVREALCEIAETIEQPFSVGYMHNAGYPEVRARLALEVAVEQDCPVKAGDVIITCGAAGGLNALLRAVLDPGDEVLAPAPFFVEYVFYTQNFGGVFKPVPAKDLTFDLDLDAFEAAITEKTRVVLVNSPNNPTGAIYSREDLEALAALLAKKSAEYGRPIYLLGDEPYRFLAYDGARVPPLLPLYPYSVVVSSFSKNLSLAGARVGYIAVNPHMPEKETLLGGLTLTNRILGFVNAPAIAQKVLLKALGNSVDASVYDARRKAMAEVLTAAGYEYAMPKGAFYFFPKAPGGDDVAFCRTLAENLVLAVPGSGFGRSGYFRLAFCVEEKFIRNSLPGFKKAIAAYK